MQVVVLATSILSTEKVLRTLPVLRLRRNTLFVDVLSVKVRWLAVMVVYLEVL
jgi:arogenate dehydrogenase (NADP+)